MNKNKLIDIIKDINILEFSIKGGTSKFNKQFPNLLNEINNQTKEIQIYSNNKKLSAKLLFLQKYYGNINKIIFNKKIMIYDSKIADFREFNINSVKKYWKNIKFELSKINDFYSKEETINLLKNSNYFGKSGNRKLLHDNKKLFVSLYYYTSNLNNLNKNFNKFSMRIYILINNIDIFCSKHNQLKFWKFNNNKFEISCSNCSPKFPQIEWFKLKYSDNWKFFYNKRHENLKQLKTNSLEWFKNKFGENIGIIKYKESVNYKMNYLSKLKANRYSKISQDLFWSIYNLMKNKNDLYFAEYNQEFVLKIPSKYNYSQTVMILDFKQNKKIIEYNGKYWHKTINDNIRYNILNDMGFEVLIINSDEYNRNKKDKIIIEKCVKFLECI